MVCLIETRKEKLVETTHPTDSVLLTDNARRKFVVELLDARTLNSGVEEEVVFCSLLCSHLRNHDGAPLLKTQVNYFPSLCRAIHSQIYGGQSLSSMPLDSHILKNLIASWSTSVSSRKSKTTCRFVTSDSINSFTWD